MISLREYQELAASTITDAVERLKTLGVDDRRIVLQAPTGSGKTVILAAALDRSAQDAAVLWLTPGSGGLHEQSFRSLASNLSGSPLSVHQLTNTWLEAHTRIEPGTVLVANWESLTQRDGDSGDYRNTLTRQSEQRNVFEALAATAEQAVPLILIIDESHYGADATRINQLLDDLNASSPALVLEASATPTRLTDAQGRKDGRHVDVFVTRDEVIDAGMIRYRVSVNSGIAARLDALSPEEIASATGESLCLEAALAKREELLEAFRAAGSQVRPLLLVQVPNGRPGEEKKGIAEAFFSGHGITRENGRLAVFMADDKAGDFDGIADDESPVDVLIFKVGIALGWDCPRAQVLVAFREIGSELLRVQTIGRILRTPERRHYGSPDALLDSAYVYSNIDRPVGAVDMDPEIEGIVDNVSLTRHTGVDPLALPAAYASRAGTYSDVKPDLFRACFDEAASTHHLAARLPQAPLAATAGLVSDQDILVADQSSDADNQQPTSVTVGASADDLQAHLEAIMVENLSPYRGRARSVPRMCQALYGWIREHMPGWWQGDNAALVQATQAAFWDQDLAALLGEVVRTAVQAHLERDLARDRVVEQFTWELPATIEVSAGSHEPMDEPLGFAFVDPRGKAWSEKRKSNPEIATEVWLRGEVAKGRILWWWKNGTNDRNCFSIAYTDSDGLPATFYPDYVAELDPSPGGKRRILIGETKGVGHKDPNTPLKAQALADYCSANETGEVQLIGGILVPFGKTVGINSAKPRYTDPEPASLTKGRSGWALVDNILY